MSKSNTRSDQEGHTPTAEPAISRADRRRDETLTRIRSALLEERLAVVTSSGENTGTDPYNSGVHRALSGAHSWSKRSR
jgi:hypothetical protein